MKKHIALTILLGAIILPSYAISNWISTAADKKRFLDTNSIQKSNECLLGDVCYSAWTKNLNTGEYDNNVWYSKTMAIYNCSKREIAIKSGTLYDLKDRAIIGKTYNISKYYLEFSPIIPESCGEVELNYICGNLSGEKQDKFTPHNSNRQSPYNQLYNYLK